MAARIRAGMRGERWRLKEAWRQAPALSPLSSLQYDPGPNGPLAQLAEQQTLNLRVEGSIPSRLTSPPTP